MNLALLALKRKADVSAEIGHYRETADAAHQMLGMLDDFEQHPADYYDQDSTYSGITVEERPRYIDFYRSRAYSFLAFAAASQHQPRQAIRYLDLYGQTDASQTLHGRYVTTPILSRLGRYDRMLAIYDEVEQSMADDTLNANYADILRGRAEAAEAQGHAVAANNYWRRYADTFTRNFRTKYGMTPTVYKQTKAQLFPSDNPTICLKPSDHLSVLL